MARFCYSPRLDRALAVELALPVVPVLPELVPLVPLALPDWAEEVVTGLALAEPVVPPLPEFPEVGLEFTVAGPVLPVSPVFPELPEVADELYCRKVRCTARRQWPPRCPRSSQITSERLPSCRCSSLSQCYRMHSPIQPWCGGR